MASPAASLDATTLARIAGLRQLDVPRLEQVDHRRAQLWGLSLLASLGVPVVIVALGLEQLPAVIHEILDVRTVRLVLLAMLIVIIGYVAEREVSLRRLTTLLVEERVLTASLVNRMDELQLLLRATRAMNSALDLRQVLTQIAESAHSLLDAAGATLLVVDPDDPGWLEVTVCNGVSDVQVGDRIALGDGLAGRAGELQDALLSTGDAGTNGDGSGRAHRRGHPASGEGQPSRRVRTCGRDMAVPLLLRGRLLAVLTVTAAVDRQAFTTFDLRGMSVFADAAAAAVGNAHAYAEQTGQVAQLIEADREKDEFLTLVTHELRTPLTSMIGLLSTLASRTLPAEQVTEFAGIAVNQGWRLDRLIGDLLDAARSERRGLEVKPQMVTVGRAVARGVQAIAQAEVDRTVSVRTDTEVAAMVDPDVLLRIVDNLLSNALKYTAPGTPIEVIAEVDDSAVRIDVIDHGAGIPAEQWSELFAKFRRGDDPYARGGMGLGLYVVQALAQAHGGRVEVSETAGGGATFSVWLATWDPLWAAFAGAGRTASDADRDGRGGGGSSTA